MTACGSWPARRTMRPKVVVRSMACAASGTLAGFGSGVTGTMVASFWEGETTVAGGVVVLPLQADQAASEMTTKAKRTNTAIRSVGRDRLGDKAARAVRWRKLVVD